MPPLSSAPPTGRRSSRARLALLLLAALILPPLGCGGDKSVTGPVDAAFVARVKRAGLQLHVWTIDDPEVARRMADAGVDGITTNRAAWMRGELARRGVRVATR